MIKRSIIVAAMFAVVGLVEGVGAQSGSASPERFVLTGVVYVDGGRGLAWIQEPTFTNNQIKTLRVGDPIGPYRLTKILEDQVELEGPNGKVSVPLAGAGGAITVATIPSTPGGENSPAVESEPTHELPPHPLLNNPDAIVVSRGDPSRNFPASDLMIGGGAELAASTGRQAQRPQAVLAPSPATASGGVVPPALQKPPQELPPHAALQNPDAFFVPRGDPRREFPASSLLIGAGAPAGGAK
jgi:hypothetical protein